MNSFCSFSNFTHFSGINNLKYHGAGIQIHQVGHVHVHPQYDYTTLFNDIALLKLQRPADFTNYVRPICLWQEDTDIRSVEGKLG